MSETVIRVEGIGKRYVIGERSPYPLLRDIIAGAFKGQFRKTPNSEKDILWALRDVSFDVKQGEVVGLVGRNGAGKSTLLKILARITRPTAGSAEIRGRIASLLEVGTGFHGELTGRENVFLTGSILGMKRVEIARKFDEIAAFSEVERFLDTPLKHYSSGMQMRLAFAVAAHLEPEILLVDEVLAVGDVSFQKKCLGKMGDVARHGRTILFVSHNMAATNALCSRALMLKHGAITADGPTAEVIAEYYSEVTGKVRDDGDLTQVARSGTGKAQFTSISVQPLSSDGRALDVAYPGCDLRIDFEIECRRPITESVAAAIIYDRNGIRVIDANTAQKGRYVSLSAGETARVSLLLREVLLRPGQYFVGLWLGRHSVENTDDVERAGSLRVVELKDSSDHPIVYPGVYLCRFDETVDIVATPSMERVVGV